MRQTVGREQKIALNADVVGYSRLMADDLGDTTERMESSRSEDTAMGLTSVTKPWYPTVKACSLFMGGNDEQAAAVVESVLEHQPNNLEALLVLAAAQSRMGLARRAAATGELIKERFPSVDIDQWIDSNPYQDQELVAEWKHRLADAGVL